MPTPRRNVSKLVSRFYLWFQSVHSSMFCAQQLSLQLLKSTCVAKIQNICQKRSRTRKLSAIKWRRRRWQFASQSVRMTPCSHQLQYHASPVNRCRHQQCTFNVNSTSKIYLSAENLYQTYAVQTCDTSVQTMVQGRRFVCGKEMIEFVAAVFTNDNSVRSQRVRYPTTCALIDYGC